MKEFSLKKPKTILRTKREKFLHLYNSLFHCHNEKAHKFHESSYKEFNSLEAKKNYISDDLFDSRVFKNKSRILSDFFFDTKKTS